MNIAMHRQKGFGAMGLGAGALALGLAAGVGAVLWMKLRSKLLDQPEAPAAAFAGTGGPTGSFVHTRDAGPDHMRDADGTDWDDVDQMSDESFPASDPPAKY